MAILGTLHISTFLEMHVVAGYINSTAWVEHLSAAIMSSERELLTGMCSTMYSVDVAIADICNVF